MTVLYFNLSEEHNTTQQGQYKFIVSILTYYVWNLGYLASKRFEIYCTMNLFQEIVNRRMLIENTHCVYVGSITFAPRKLVVENKARTPTSRGLLGPALITTWTVILHKKCAFSTHQQTVTDLRS